MKFSKNILSLAVLTALTACGGSDDKKVNTDPDPDPVPVEKVVTGNAVKGVIANGVVVVYKYVNGVAVELDDTELKEASVTTNDDGSYSFTVVDYDGPIKVEIKPSTDPSSPTTMTCDAPSGCGNVVFGDPINLTDNDPDFTLAAVTNVDEASTGDVTLNVSALTHLATQLIEEADVINEQAIQDNASIVANAFGISGDITQLAPTKVNKLDEVTAEDNDDELKYGLINAGIAEALFSGETDVSVLSVKLADVAADLVANDGAFSAKQDDDDTTFELAITDVLAGASQAALTIANEIAADVDLTGTEDILAGLDVLEDKLENEKVLTESKAGDDGFIPPVSDVVTDGGEVDKAKAMVNDVRLFTNLFDPEHESNQGITANADEFTALIENAGEMIDLEAENIVVLSNVAEVVSMVNRSLKEGTLDGIAFSIQEVAPESGIQGSITLDKDALLFNVDAVQDGQSFKLNAEVLESNDGLTHTINLDGMVMSESLSLTIAEGSSVELSFDVAVTPEGLVNDTVDAELTAGKLNLQVELAQLATEEVINPVTFSGMLMLDIVTVEENFVENEWAYNVETQMSETNFVIGSEIIPVPKMFTLSGEFSSLDGDSISATLALNIDNADGFESQEVDLDISDRQLEDAFTIDVSADGNTVVAALMGSYTETVTYQATPGDLAGYEINLVRQEQGEDAVTVNRTVMYSEDIAGLDADVVYVTHEYPNWAEIIKIIPVDGVMQWNEELQADELVNADGMTDYYNVVIHYGQYINDNGQLVDHEGGLVESFDEHYAWSFDSYETADWSQIWNLAGDPHDETAISLYQAHYKFMESQYRHGGWIDGKGLIEPLASPEEIDQLAADTSASFDAFWVEVDETSYLESEDSYLELMASLNVAVTLGDYDVDMTLSGQRTGLEAGIFELEMAYQLPGDTAQRAFTIMANSEDFDADDGQVMVSNAEGVKVVLYDPENVVEDQGEKTIGKITVTEGDKTTHVAGIVDRGSLIQIIYSNGDVESL